MAHWHYRMVAIGIAMLLMNVRFNGLQLLFPHFVGYCTICVGWFQLRRNQAGAWWPVISAGLLTLMTFPDFFVTALRYADPNALRWYYRLTEYPYGVIQAVLMLSLGALVAARAARRGRKAIAVLGMAGALFGTTCIIWAYFPAHRIWAMWVVLDYLSLLMLVGAYAAGSRELA